MKKLILLALSHGLCVAFGVGLGFYLLPILTAPPAPDAEILAEKAEAASFTAQFKRDLPGSDFLHWGQGQVSLSEREIVHQGGLAPGPDYKVYLVPAFVDDAASFNALKDQSAYVGDVKSFNGFVLPVPENIDITQYNTLVVWCERFGVFITSAQYKN